jgi:hypothetical protein
VRRAGSPWVRDSLAPWLHQVAYRVVNRFLGLHQFDEPGLGMSDGDQVLNHLERVAYIIKGGEPVKLANFADGSVLRPARAKPAISNHRLWGPGIRLASTKRSLLRPFLLVLKSLEASDTHIKLGGVVGTHIRRIIVNGKTVSRHA